METAASIGEYLRTWRQRRRMSQLDLALDAEVSTKHLSFLETGRSAPSREMVLRLAEPIALDDYETHRRTGGFLLVDPADGSTLAAGMVGATLLDRLLPTAAQPQDDMWRSRRVLSGSNWMDAWVRKPGQR